MSDLLPVIQPQQRPVGDLVQFTDEQVALIKRNDRRLPDRFWSKVCATESGCWLWTGAKNSCGYGCFCVRKPVIAYAHRHAFETLVGAIPDGLVLDHLCRTPACVRPLHLRGRYPGGECAQGA